MHSPQRPKLLDHLNSNRLQGRILPDEWQLQQLPPELRQLQQCIGLLLVQQRILFKLVNPDLQPLPLRLQHLQPVHPLHLPNLQQRLPTLRILMRSGNLLYFELSALLIPNCLQTMQSVLLLERIRLRSRRQHNMLKRSKWTFVQQLRQYLLVLWIC